MARIRVINPHGVHGSLDEGDTVGSSFTPDISPFTGRDLAEIGITALSAPMNPMALPQLFGQVMRHAPTSSLEPAFATAGAVGGSLTPAGPVAGAGLGGMIGRGMAETRMNPQIGAGELAAKSGLAGLRDAASTYVLGGIAKGATGGSMKFLQRVSPPLVASPLARIGASGVGGAVAGAASMPQYPFQGATIGGLTGAAGQGVAEGIGVTPHVKTAFSEKRQVALSRNARQIFEQVKSGSGPAFEATLSRLPGTVDVSPEVNHSLELMTQQSNPQAMAIVEEALANAEKVGDTTLRRFLQNPELAKQATPLEAHQVATTMQQVPSIMRRLQGTTPQSGGMQLMRMGALDTTLEQMSNGIKNRIAELHPDIYPQALKQYGQIQQTAKFLTPEFSPRKNRLFANVRSGFGGGETAEMVRETLPESVSNQIFTAANVRKNVGYLKYLNPFAWKK